MQLEWYQTPPHPSHSDRKKVYRGLFSAITNKAMIEINCLIARNVATPTNARKVFSGL